MPHKHKRLIGLIREEICNTPLVLPNSKNNKKAEALSEYLVRIHSIPAVKKRTSFRDELKGAILLLMVYLGPPDIDGIPAPLFNELLGHARTYVIPILIGSIWSASEFDKLVQLALAYGCLWRRQETTGINGSAWDSLWPDARKELVNLARRYVKGANEKLCDEVHGFWERQLQSVLMQRSNNLYGYADDIISMWVGQPCPPGPADYEEYFTIQTWDPHERHLYAHLHKAVVGMFALPKPPNRIRANEFNCGLLHREELKRDQFLLDGPVAFEHCLEPCCPSASKDTEYLELPCRPAHQNRIAIYYIMLLVVPSNNPAQIAGYCFENKFRRCCKRLIIATPKCPLCHRKAPKKWLPPNPWHCDRHYYEATLANCPYCFKPAPKCSPKTTTLLVR